MSEEKQAAGTLVDTVLDGRYHIEKLLGEGGMGAAYAATDQRLARVPTSRRGMMIRGLRGDLGEAYLTPRMSGVHMFPDMAKR